MTIIPNWKVVAGRAWSVLCLYAAFVVQVGQYTLFAVGLIPWQYLILGTLLIPVALMLRMVKQPEVSGP